MSDVYTYISAIVCYMLHFARPYGLIIREQLYLYIVFSSARGQSSQSFGIVWLICVCIISLNLNVVFELKCYFVNSNSIEFRIVHGK